MRFDDKTCFISFDIGHYRQQRESLILDGIVY